MYALADMHDMNEPVRAPRVDIKPGEVWHIKRPGSWACDTVKIDEVTPATVLFSAATYAAGSQRMMRCDVHFVERVSPAPSTA